MKGGASDYSKVKGEAFREENSHSKVGTIRSELTQNNYSLINKDAPEDIDGYIKSLGVKRKIRADANRFVSAIIDLPKDETREPREFFQDVIKGYQKYFNIKDEAILYAQVHMDEAHPHLHLAFVPLVEAEKIYKDGHGEKQIKLSAKEVVDALKLKELHPYIQRYMNDRGYTGTIHYNDGVKRDKAFLEHKLEQIKKEIDINEEWIQNQETVIYGLDNKQIELQETLIELTEETKDIAAFNELKQTEKTEIEASIKTLNERYQIMVNQVNKTVDAFNHNNNLIEQQLKKIEENNNIIENLSNKLKNLQTNIDIYISQIKDIIREFLTKKEKASILGTLHEKEKAINKAKIEAYQRADKELPEELAQVTKEEVNRRAHDQER